MKISTTVWLGAVVAGVALSGCSGKQAETAQVSSQPATQGTAQAQPAAASVASSKLDRLFLPEIIGGTVAGFEAVSGPATQVLQAGSDADGMEKRSYRVGGCLVTVNDTKGVINAVSLAVGSTCAVSLHTMLPNAPALDVSRLTFATLSKSGATGTMLACAAFAECGNYADPSIEAALGGSRADGFLEVRFTGTIASDADTATLSDMMRAEAAHLGMSDNGDLDAKAYNQDPQFMREVEAKLGGVKVTSITLQSGM